VSEKRTRKMERLKWKEIDAPLTVFCHYRLGISSPPHLYLVVLS